MLDMTRVRARATKVRDTEAKKRPTQNQKVEKTRRQRALGIPPRKVKTENQIAGEKKGHFKTGTSVRRCPHWIERPATGEPRRCNQVCVSGHDYCRHHITKEEKRALARSRQAKEPELRVGAEIIRDISLSKIVIPDRAWHSWLWQALSEVVPIVPYRANPQSNLSSLDRAKLQQLKRSAIGGVISGADWSYRRRWARRHMVEILEAWSEYETGRPSRWLAVCAKANRDGITGPFTQRAPTSV